jgi:glycosyltransferase involved in cell wall biosynthesis
VVATPSRPDLTGDDLGSVEEVLVWNAVRSPGPSVAAETRSLAKIIDSVQPTLVHLHSSKAGLAGRLALRGRRPTVFQPHSWSFEAVEGTVRWAAIRWERLGTRWAHSTLCVSESERDRGIAQGIRASYRVVPNGVDLTVFSEAGEPERRAARQRLGLEDRPLVVCVGRLSRQKGQDVLLEAWPFVRAQVADAELVLVGGGELEAALRRSGGDGVSIVGARDDVPAWLAAADVVALPSRWEGMSLGLLEAMARGRSVVATDVGGVREAIGSAGAVVPAEDKGALSSAIAERLVDPARRALEGAEAAERARSRHDLRDTLRRTAELYHELLATSA